MPRAAELGAAFGLHDGFRADPEPAAVPVDDVRTMAVQYNASGEREREFRAAVNDMSQDEWPDWPIRGPRTCRWVLSFMREHGGTPRGWRRRWQSEMRLQSTDGGVLLHETCCQFLESLCCFDQLNAPNLAAAEHACRQLQAVEERWKDRVVGSSEAQGAQADLALYAGQQTRANLCIAPQLSAWISDQLRAESSIAKERRKAREERALARPKGASSKKKSDE